MDQHSAKVPVFVGIDVAKDRLDVHLLPSGAVSAVTRDHAGLERLVAHLRQATPALVVLEATGGVAAHHDVGVAALLEVRIKDRFAGLHAARTGPPAVPWRIRGFPQIHQMICYFNSLKYNTEKV